MRAHIQNTLFALALAATASCNSSSSPKPRSLDDYDQTCTTVLDCAAVFFDEASCCFSNCPNSAIRASEVARFDADAMTQRPACMGVAAVCTRPSNCGDKRLQCVQGLCVLEQSDAATGN